MPVSFLPGPWTLTSRLHLNHEFMTPEDGVFLKAGEYGLVRELSPLAEITRAIGARSVAVLVCEKAAVLRVVFRWPEAAEDATELCWKADAAELRGLQEGIATADSTIGRFLAQATASAGVFFLVPWRGREREVLVAFGVPSPEPSFRLGEECVPAIQLAAAAAWSAVEVHRLRNELTALNERLGRRKLVERAKGLLQARNGWSEEEAYGELRKLSRQRRKTLAETAEDLLRSSRRPTG